MSNYIGVRCPVCNKKFTEADDIVVCPVCGAPHHRGCYAERNQCAFVDDHLTGKEWSDPAGRVTEDGEARSAVKACARCGAENPRDAIFCATCGFPMTLPENRQGDAEGGETPFPWAFTGGMGAQVDTITMAYGGLAPDDEIDGETVKELAKYVGGGSAYYLPRFRVMSEYGKAFMPNFYAFLFSFYYYFYRKMYAIGTLLLAITAVSMIPDCLLWAEVSLPAFLANMKTTMPELYQQLGITAAAVVSQAAADHYLWLANIARTLRLVIVLIFSLFANRAYYGKAVAAVHSIRAKRAESGAEEEYYEALSQAGGTSKTAVILLFAAIAAVGFGFSYVMLFSAGQ